MPTKKAAKKVTKKAVVKKAPKKVVAKKSVKKVAKKSLTKKVSKKTTKKAVTKKNSSKPLVLASDQTSFWVTDGSILNSLVALKDALDTMEKSVYSYHAGNAQNDFANWVSVVLEDEACAQDLEKAKTPKSAKTTIVRHLKFYTF